MVNHRFLKIYIIVVILISFTFLGLNLIAEVEQTPHILKKYLKSDYTNVSECPNFIDVNEMTMRDECTGLIWARQELPTYKQVTDPSPGYTWEEAVIACEDLAEDNGRDLFRLPTVEELLTRIEYNCGDNPNLCAAGLALVDSDSYPFFSSGVYWSINDFHESDSWKDPNAFPPGKAIRDYKRSVNLLNGEVDTPVFNKVMKLNAWCVLDKQPHELVKQFTGTFTGYSDITNGTGIQGGDLQTIYNRTCSVSADCTNKDGDIIGGTCENSFCSETKTISFDPIVTSCGVDRHVEGTECILVQNNPYSLCDGTATRCGSDADCGGDPGSCQAVCPTPELDADGIQAYEVWRGSTFNGFRVCHVNDCGGTELHKDPITDVCVPDHIPCFFDDSSVSDPDGWTTSAQRDWVLDTGTGLFAWNECHALECSYDSEPIDTDGDPINTINYNATCQCNYNTRDGVCTKCTDAEHYKNGDYSACVPNVGDDCSIESEIKREVWQGNLFSGDYICTFINCATDYHENIDGVCVSNTRDCAPYPAFAEVATQTWNIGSSSWNACVIASCDPGAIPDADPITSCACSTADTGPAGFHASDEYRVCIAGDVPIGSFCNINADCGAGGDCDIRYLTCESNTTSCDLDDDDLNNLYGLVSSAEKLWDDGSGEYGACYATACSVGKFCASALEVGLELSGTPCTSHANCSGSYPVCYPAVSILPIPSGTEPNTTCDLKMTSSVSGQVTDNTTLLPISGALVFFENVVTGYDKTATVNQLGQITNQDQSVSKTCSQEFPESDSVIVDCSVDADCTNGAYPYCFNKSCTEYVPVFSTDACNVHADCTPTIYQDPLTACTTNTDCSSVAGHPYCINGFCADDDKVSCSLPGLAADEIGYNYLVTTDASGNYLQTGMYSGVYDVTTTALRYSVETIDIMIVDGSVTGQNFQLLTEICENDLDDNFNGLTDEGCTNITITISDCGSGADDAFDLWVDGVNRGQTLIGQDSAVTINQLPIGFHTIRSSFIGTSPAGMSFICGSECIDFSPNVVFHSGPFCTSTSNGCTFDGWCTLDALDAYWDGVIYVSP